MPGAALTSLPFTVMESLPDINWQHLQFFLKHGRVLPYLLPTAKFSTVLKYCTRLYSYDLPYRLIKSRWLVGTDDLFTVETIHSSRVSKFWFFSEILDLMTI